MKKVTKEQCPYCLRLISKSNMSKHIRSHANGNFDKWNSSNKTTYHIDHDNLKCKFCHEFEAKNKNSLAQHEIRCIKNPDKIDTSHSFGNHKLENRSAWNKGLTKETDERVKQGAENYSKNHNLGLHKDMSGENNPSCRQEVKDKISKSCLQRSKEGTWHNGGTYGINVKYNGNNLDSTWELRYALYLDNNNIQWKRNKESFEYIYNDEVHYYTPDFYLVDTDEYIEIKGIKTDVDLAKWSQFPKDKKLVILEEKELKDLGVFEFDISTYLQKNA